jgi:nucleoside-diphosphate-sugar epimerase
MKTDILITGATGKTGLPVVERLFAHERPLSNHDPLTCRTMVLRPAKI